MLVDLKRRIQGDFRVIEEDADRIVLGNRACPFGDKVLGRPSMRMMTSNVFGHIAADNLGYARVELQETVSRGTRAAGWWSISSPPGNRAKGGNISGQDRRNEQLGLLGFGRRLSGTDAAGVA